MLAGASRCASMRISVAFCAPPPATIHVRGDASPERAWLSQFGQIAVAESRAKRAGGEGMLARMSELMFIEVVRSHIATLPEEQTGWLAGLRDRSVSRAQPAAPSSHPWMG
jgi:hypothetical protein